MVGKYLIFLTQEEEIVINFIGKVFERYTLLKKSNLPIKICPVCNLPFTWRKKWEKNWENVKYCSKRCRKN
jgi:hypothetical protein